MHFNSYEELIVLADDCRVDLEWVYPKFLNGLYRIQPVALEASEGFKISTLPPPPKKPRDRLARGSSANLLYY